MTEMETFQKTTALHTTKIIYTYGILTLHLNAKNI